MYETEIQFKKSHFKALSTATCTSTTAAARIQMGIHYPDLVIEVSGDCGMDCLVPLLTNLLARGDSIIQRKQQAIAKFRSLLTYGMEDNALQYPDAVAAILVQARHFVMLNNKNNEDKERQQRAAGNMQLQSSQQ